MPGMDGTGPQGYVAGTGCGFGACAERKGNELNRFGFGIRRRGCGFGNSNCSQRIDNRWSTASANDLQTLEGDERWLETLLAQVRAKKAEFAASAER